VTLVVKRSGLAGDFVTGGQDTVGVRVPDHPLALGLLEAFERAGGKGVAAPSANRFGRVSPTSAQAVSDDLGRYLLATDQILDGGQCAIGVESTIIDCTPDVPRILRPGAVTAGMITQSTRERVLSESGLEDLPLIRVSGALGSHYAPKARIVLDQTPMPGSGLIALANFPTPAGVIRLASPRDLGEYARVLYQAFRDGDELKLNQISVFQPPASELGLAIRDRLLKASASDTERDDQKI
jgi:L-threonylcarbamoyladenylate synthase